MKSLGLLSIALAVMLAAAYSGYQELLLFAGSSKHAGGTTDASFQVEQRFFALSSYSKEIALADCRAHIASIYVRMQPAAVRRQIADNCRSMALDIARRAPTIALAWCVAAETSAELGDSSAFLRYLNECHRTAPWELWLAAIRFHAALANDLRASPAIRSALHDDIALLMESYRGRLILAAAFAGEPTVRKLISRALENSSDAAKTAFISALHQETGS